jgi:hypothetical protein
LEECFYGIKKENNNNNNYGKKKDCIDMENGLCVDNKNNGTLTRILLCRTMIDAINYTYTN